MRRIQYPVVPFFRQPERFFRAPALADIANDADEGLGVSVAVADYGPVLLAVHVCAVRPPHAQRITWNRRIAVHNLLKPGDQ